MAPKKQKTTAITKWSEKFAQYAQKSKEQLKNIGTGGVSVKFGRNSISIGDREVKGGQLEVVVLGYVAHNRWFKGKYNPKETTPPDCYSFAIVFDDPGMAPHKSCDEPQADLCKDCDKNKFGSAETGRGKACQNTVRLGLLLADDLKDGKAASAAELASASVSPTNLKHFKKYVEQLDEDHSCPTWAAVTEITSHDDPETQIRLEFKLVELIEDDDILTALEKRIADNKVEESLMVPYQAAGEKPAPSKTAAKRKFATAKGKK